MTLRFLYCLLFIGFAGVAQQAYNVIPKLQFQELREGVCKLDNKVTILNKSGSKACVKALSKHTGWKEAKGRKARVVLLIDSLRLNIDSTLSNWEGYSIEISEKRIKIIGNSEQGLFYGIQSLRQLLPVYLERKTDTVWSGIVSCGKIEDYPRFAYRGMHFDVGRHFFSVAQVKEYIDMLALHKMNTFHWHLTEDQGWRIEIKKYPKLTEIGGFRAQTAIGRAGSKNAPYKYDSTRYGGFYTQEEIKEVVQYAADNFITVIPEIELPGHSLAALAAYPEYGNGTGPYKVAERWGIFKQVYAPTEQTFQFLEDILSEVIPLFPGKYIHIGGDECLKDEWKKSEYAQKLIKEKGLKDEHGLQSYFIQRIEKFVNSKGKSIIGWDEILEGGLAPNATVMSWRGTKGGIAAAKAKHNVIMSPYSHCYFDFYQVCGDARQKQPIAGSDRCTTLEKVYSYDPIPSSLTNEEAKYVLGAQGNVWTEYMPTWEVLQMRVLPRMTALSEVVWTHKGNKDWGDFQQRLVPFQTRYTALGYNYFKK